MAAIELSGVTKMFEDVVGVSDLDLEVEEGEIFGFLGPNGAGKTTTIDLMLDFIRPDRGDIRVLGQPVADDPRSIRQRTGVLPEGAEVWDRLTGREHLEFVLDSKGAEANPETFLERVGLDDAIDRKAGGYSKGMQQRLLLAMALVGDPELLILDEPSTGLDPNGAREMREIVQAENGRGATVFFSSHILGQVEAVCDRVGIIHQGEMVAIDSIEGLRSAVGGGTTLRVSVERAPDAVLDDIRAIDEITTVSRVDGDSPQVAITGSGSKTDVLGVFEDAGIEILDFRTEEVSLEELFRAYTSEEEVAT